jgi:hypothetical protein
VETAIENIVCGGGKKPGPHRGGMARQSGADRRITKAGEFRTARFIGSCARRSAMDRKGRLINQ